ncbi:hypothetical protein H5410_036930 [Solanum commersonii]|uniref:Uncharacterized protein n=1 Tax=Solanum commersonii TaxID=4109 RepID=A0A9J5Y6M1_SOLCO|nr:hypothetical protein H5410_036930 [Solanum commersonii]
MAKVQRFRMLSLEGIRQTNTRSTKPNKENPRSTILITKKIKLEDKGAKDQEQHRERKVHEQEKTSILEDEQMGTETQQTTSDNLWYG